tara:strand:- start:295 stop:480 length:186 start_codon:yes stop_codon:yes gene_type:complete
MKNNFNHAKLDSWMDIKDVVGYSRLSESTIRRAIQKGELKVSKRTGKLLFKVSSVERWLNG